MTANNAEDVLRELKLVAPEDEFIVKGETKDIGNGGRKNDAGKIRLSLIDSGLPWELGRVLTHGAVKYAPHNWRKFDTVGNKEDRERLYSAQLRHLYKALDGEVFDPDSFEDRLRENYQGEELRALIQIGPLLHQAQVAFYSMVFIRNDLDRIKAKNGVNGNGTG